MAVREGFKALPRRGLETGGLLIGRRKQEGDTVTVEVDDFEPIESEHAAGPAYLLSAADRRLLEARMAAREAAGGSSSIVGFYRSHTRPDFAITEEDASLYATYFRDPSDVFLLIKPEDGGPPTGGFIIREGGTVLSDSPYAQFRLEGKIGIPAAREAPVRAVQEPRATVRPIRSVPPPALRQAKWRVSRPLWALAAGATILAAGLYLAMHRRVSDAASVRSERSLGLNVTSVENSLKLSWDHQLPPHSGNAVLRIRDGQEEEQRLELNAKQLSEGSVVYWPRHNDVDFRFELFSPSGNVSQSVRSIGGPTKPASVNPAPKTAAVEPPIVPAPARKSVREKRPAPTASALKPKVQPRNRTVTASLQPARTFAMPRRASNPPGGAAPSVPDPPGIHPVPTEHSKEVLKTIGPDKIPTRVDPPFRVTVEPVSGARRNIPLIGKHLRRPDYVPPAALRDPGLSIPANRNLPKDVKINVKVYVNPSGGVDYSEVTSKVPETDRDLASLAVFAARRWEFAPAREGDSTVAGEVILHYQFGPGARAAR
jgi:hypothetical protein